jgi:hypothetical protein
MASMAHLRAAKMSTTIGVEEPALCIAAMRVADSAAPSAPSDLQIVVPTSPDVAAALRQPGAAGSDEQRCRQSKMWCRRAALRHADQAAIKAAIKPCKRGTTFPLPASGDSLICLRLIYA